MDSSKFLRKSAKGGDRFEWTGSFQDLDKFFSALGYTGTWSQPSGEGNPHKFTNKQFTCTWFATKKSLLIQGKKASELKDKLKEVLIRPIPLTAATMSIEKSLRAFAEENLDEVGYYPVIHGQSTLIKPLALAVKKRELFYKRPFAKSEMTVIGGLEDYVVKDKRKEFTETVKSTIKKAWDLGIHEEEGAGASGLSEFGWEPKNVKVKVVDGLGGELELGNLDKEFVSDQDLQDLLARATLDINRMKDLEGHRLRLVYSVVYSERLLLKADQKHEVAVGAELKAFPPGIPGIDDLQAKYAWQPVIYRKEAILSKVAARSTRGAVFFKCVRVDYDKEDGKLKLSRRDIAGHAFYSDDGEYNKTMVGSENEDLGPLSDSLTEDDVKKLQIIKKAVLIPEKNREKRKQRVKKYLQWFEDALMKDQKKLHLDEPFTPEDRDFLQSIYCPALPGNQSIVDLSSLNIETIQGYAIVLKQIDGFLMTPQEILARGPLPMQIYNKALKEGKTNVRRLPIMLIGQERMGKTSLKKSLKGDLFDAEEESTTGIEVDPSYCKITTEIWRPGKPDETTCSDSAISFEHQAARLIVRDMKERETSQATTGEPTQATNSSQPHHEPSTSRDTHVTTRKVPNTNRKQLITKSISEDIKVGQEREQPLIEPNMPDDLANLIAKSIFEDIEVDEGEQIYSIVWDFGGQSVYYVTHPLYLTTRAIYLLVYSLSRSPNDRAIPVMKQGVYKKLEDSYSVKTNLDYLDSWMSSVASLVSDGDDDDEVPASHQTEKLPSKLPPVFLVCTHADQPYCGRDSATLAAEIFGSLQGKPYSSHLYDSVFAVDNMKSGSEYDCPEVVRLRKEILAAAKELPQMKEEIPLKWLKFEKALQVKIKEGYKWISLENAKQAAFEMCHISAEEEFTTLMKFLHDQRILINFDDTPSLNQMVVLDIQWLIDVFKKVITVDPYGGNGKQYKDLWLKLEKTGILEEKLLEHVWGPLYKNKETFESLIEIMEKFSLLCIWPSSDESKQYLVPSMLMSHPSQGIIQLVASSQIPSLYLTFNSSQVPIGLFPRMVLQFYQWCSKEWPSPFKPQLFHNFARFNVSPDEGCSVILLCHSSFIEIVVHRANKVRDLPERLQAEMKLPPNLASDPSPDVRIARAVRRQVGLMLECMRKEFVWLRNMKCEMKVLCSVCCPGGSIHYCPDHFTEGCKREECLHFWSETNLQSGKLICDRSAVAGDLRLSIKQFASWFPFLDEQQAIECAARELPSIEEKETKTLVLSTGVIESLQSTCDASNVVARLQDYLQLNQAALADPEPETTRMIRCLATIAKNENRLDVVQHLRHITPAGTTGPLLPERLDVRKIPPPQIRELTIDLCGGEEWKLVASKLGLSPAEIRYLNNRTMNPSIEALVHSRNQRFINVDTLYNVLVECGLPMLADLL